jgi:hypothetical protein
MLDASSRVARNNNTSARVYDNHLGAGDRKINLHTAWRAELNSPGGLQINPILPCSKVDILYSALPNHPKLLPPQTLSQASVLGVVGLNSKAWA